MFLENLFSLSAVFTLVPIVCAAYAGWYYAVHVPRYPRGPRPWPLLGNFFQIRTAGGLANYLEQAEKHFGPVFTIYAPRPLVVLTGYEAIREALAEKNSEFHNKTPVYRLMSLPPNGGIISASGDVWLEQKRVALHILRHLGKGSTSMEQRVLTSVGDMLEYLHSIAERENVDLCRPLELCIGNVMNELLFGETFHYTSAERFHHFFAVILRFLMDAFGRSASLYNRFPILTHIPVVNSTYRRMRSEYKAYMVDFIGVEVEAERAKFEPTSPTGNNFVQAYLAEMESGGKGNPFLSVEQLHSVVADLWVTGVEGPSRVLKWILLYLVKYPDAQAKAYREVERVVSRDRLPTMRDQADMPYVMALIGEVLRLRGTAALEYRFFETDECIAHERIPAHTFILPYLRSVLDKSLLERNHEFHPDRFLDADGRKQRCDIPQRLITFGVGSRLCPGESLARAELFLTTCALLQRYELHSVAGEEVDLSPIFDEIPYPKSQAIRLLNRI